MSYGQQSSFCAGCGFEMESSEAAWPCPKCGLANRPGTRVAAPPRETRTRARTTFIVIAALVCLGILKASIPACTRAVQVLVDRDWRSSPPSVKTPPAEPAVPSPSPAVPAAPPAPSATEPPPPFPDMAHVDPADVYPEAKRMALAINGRAELEEFMPIVQNGGIVGGTVDLTGDQCISYDFDYSYLDLSAPPGKDLVQGRIDIIADHSGLHVFPGETPAAPFPPFVPGPHDPKCSVREAWKTAVATGVPEEATASLRYADNSAFDPHTSFVWSFTVTGHGEYRREIDGRTCALVKSWGPKPAAERPAGKLIQRQTQN
jgi:hypothetical protein